MVDRHPFLSLSSILVLFGGLVTGGYYLSQALG